MHTSDVRVSIVTAALAVALVIGAASVQPGWAQDASLPFETVGRGLTPAFQDAQQVVIRDGDAWQALWTRVQGWREQAPPVDFNTSMVIGVIAGTTTGADATSATITRIAPELNALRVFVTEQSPPKLGNSLAAQAPYHFVKIARSLLAVRFSVVGRALSQP
jgi:hypothetical protein